MKCVKNPIDGTLKRVTEYEARTKYLPYGWVYASKGEWKKAVRPNLSAMKAAAAQAAAKLRPVEASPRPQAAGTRRV